MKEKKIMFVGDVHGDWTSLNYFIQEHDPDILFIAGDVAYFWKHDFHDSEGKIKPGRTKIYWVAGNHENHSILKSSGKFPYGKIHKLETNIYFCAFGSTLKLPDGRTILFVGGADSIDKQYRIIGKDWWRNETIQNDEFDALPDPKKVKIDIVLSHTNPTSFELHLSGYRTEKYYDPSCKALQQILERYEPSLWFFGHYHHFQRGKMYGCEWFALNCIGEGGRDGIEGYRILDNLDMNEDYIIQENIDRELRQRAYFDENERRKDPNYVNLSEWPDELGTRSQAAKLFKTKKELDF